jgi:hypothetical protein
MMGSGVRISCGTNNPTISVVSADLWLFPTLFTTGRREQRRRALEFGAMHHHQLLIRARVD